MGSAYCDDRGAFKHGVALVHMDGCHGAGVVGFDGVLHLHGFKDCHLLSGLHCVARLYGDLHDHTRKRGSDRLACA